LSRRDEFAPHIGPFPLLSLIFLSFGAARSNPGCVRFITENVPKTGEKPAE
jgi:hypothetical protein